MREGGGVIAGFYGTYKINMHIITVPLYTTLELDLGSKHRGLKK